MKDEIIDNIIIQLSHTDFSEEQLNKIKSCMQINLTGYDVQKIQYELAPYVEVSVLERFMVAKKLEGKSDATLATYLLALKNFFYTINIPVEKIDTDCVRLYLYQYQKQRGITNRSLESMRKIFSSFFTWCAKEDIITKNPMLKISPIKYTTVPRTSIAPLDLEKIREACTNLRDKALIEFLFSTGARVSEVSTTKISDVNLHEKSVQLLGKGSKIRTVYLNARAELALTRYLESRDDSNPSLFVSLRRPHKTLQKPGIEAVVKRIVKTTDITAHITPHNFRHTNATVALQNGMTVQEVQKLLGHSDINTTMIYAEVDDEELRLKAKKLIN